MKAKSCDAPEVAGVTCACTRCAWGSGLNSAFGSSACFADFHIAAAGVFTRVPWCWARDPGCYESTPSKRGAAGGRGISEAGSVR